VIADVPVDPRRFRGWIGQRLGLHFDDSKLEFLGEVLGRRSEVTRLAPHRYLDRLEGPDGEAEVRALIRELTVPETYFFRHIDQFHAFAEVALPEAQAARQSVRKLRFLSAGCASGEEPYSLAILVRERAVSADWNVTIRAVDINHAMLAKAAGGHYTTWALRETPADIQRRWFRSAGREFVLEDSIRAAVTFQQGNLAEANADLWAPESYDVIFCRNVLMYFTPQTAQAAVRRMTRALAPGGHLFLGHAETLRGLSNDYHLCHTHGTFYYRRKEERQDWYLDESLGEGREETRPESAERNRDEARGSRHAWPDRASLNGSIFHAAGSEPKKQEAASLGGAFTPAAAAVPRAALTPAPGPAPGPAWARTWLETIQDASDRIQALHERPASPPAPRSMPAAGGAPAHTATQLQFALELLKKERFADALTLLGHLPAESVQDPDVLLLRAALLTHSGELTSAESVCAQLLERDELSTGAHYLLALCRESAGDRQGALDHDQAAIYLDPDFAMPRLHLGLMARRGGDLESARRELGQALLLLKREDASRLLLFGGGFGREALIALCRTELLSAGGLP